MIKAGNKQDIYMKQIDNVKISIALMSIYVILTIQYFVLISFRLTGTDMGSKVQFLSKVLVGILFLYALPVVLKRSKRKLIITYSITVLIFALHYLFFPANRLYLKELIFPLFFMSLPAFVYSMSLSNYTVFKRVMKKAGMIVFITGAVLSGLILGGRASAGTYSMTLSYYMLLPTIMFLDGLLERFSLKLLLFTMISLFVILALGSRGAVLCIVVFVFLKFIRPDSSLSYKKLFVYFGLLSAGLLGCLFLNKILETLDGLFLNFGVRSRSISLFLREEIHLSGRDRIYENVVEKILESPILGMGIGGDRYVLEGRYAHNVFIEVLANFGIIIGTILLLILIVLCINALFLKNKDKANIFIIWFAIGFVPLMVSGSYITGIKFWIFLGLTIKAIKINKSIKYIQ